MDIRQGRMKILHPRDALRKCRGRYFERRGHNAEVVNFEIGYFHGFGIGYEELSDGVSHFSAAIVEFSDGKIRLVPASEIQFID